MLEKYDDILTSQEICDVLHIGKTTLYNLLKNKKIQSIKIGNSYRVTKLWLLEYINQSK